MNSVAAQLASISMSSAIDAVDKTMDKADLFCGNEEGRVGNAPWADRKEDENANQDMSLVVDPDAGEEWSPTTPAISPDKGGPKEVHGGNDQHLAFKCDTPDTRTSARMDDDEWKATTPAVSPAEYDAVCSIFEQACTRRGVMSPRDAMGNGSTRDKHDSSPPAADMKWSAAMSPEDLLLQLLAEDRQQQGRDLRKKKWNLEGGNVRSSNVLGGGIEMSATPLSPRVQASFMSFPHIREPLASGPLETVESGFAATDMNCCSVLVHSDLEFINDPSDIRFVENKHTGNIRSEKGSSSKPLYLLAHTTENERFQESPEETLTLKIAVDKAEAAIKEPRVLDRKTESVEEKSLGLLVHNVGHDPNQEPRETLQISVDKAEAEQPVVQAKRGSARTQASSTKAKLVVCAALMVAMLLLGLFVIRPFLSGGSETKMLLSPGEASRPVSVPAATPVPARYLVIMAVYMAVVPGGVSEASFKEAIAMAAQVDAARVFVINVQFEAERRALYGIRDQTLQHHGRSLMASRSGNNSDNNRSSNDTVIEKIVCEIKPLPEDLARAIAARLTKDAINAAMRSVGLPIVVSLESPHVLVAGHCDPGYAGVACVACVKGKASAGTATCISCEAGKFSPDAAAVCTDCRAGTFSVVAAGNCTECDGGKYSLFGSGECMLCEMGQYSGDAASKCESCEAGKYSGMNSSTCTACKAGTYSGAGAGTCAKCVGGKYSGDVAPSCIKCGAGTFSGMNASNCSQCRAGTYSKVGADACEECGAGTFSGAAAAACTDCEGGKYSGSSGAEGCATCGVNTYSSADRSQCMACPSRSVSNQSSAGLTDCKCDVGATGPDGGTCLPCPAGTFKNLTGSVACTRCAFKSTSPNSSVAATDCRCFAGYTGPNGGVCSECPAGTYKEVLGSAPCLNACPANTNSPVASKAVSECICNAGYTGPDGQVCVDCAAGKFKVSRGSGACTSCPSNAESPAASVNATQCMCNKGYSGANGEACVACVAGTFKDVKGSVACEACAAGKFSVDVAATGESTCLDCPAGSESPAASGANTECLCKPGYSGPDGGPCTICPLGKYKVLAGADACSDCPVDSSAPAGSKEKTACICVAGTSGPVGGDACVSCDAGKFKDAEGTNRCTDCAADTISPVKSTTATACQCMAGTTGADGGPCAPCGAGKYKEAVGSATCDDCGADSTAPERSTARTACECNGGTSGPNGGPCTQCTKGTYKPTRGSAECNSCEKGKYAGAGVETCTECEAGKYAGGAAGTCSDCEVGKYAGGAGAEACIECEAGKYAEGAASACTECGGGTFAEAGAGSCTECEAGKYSDSAAGICIECGSNANNDAVGSTSCFCDPGHSGDGLSCSPCEAGKFKASKGNDDCTPCPSEKPESDPGAVECREPQCEDDPNWESDGYGDTCDMYAPGAQNEGYCSDDDACAPCGCSCAQDAACAE